MLGFSHEEITCELAPLCLQASAHSLLIHGFIQWLLRVMCRHCPYSEGSVREPRGRSGRKDALCLLQGLRGSGRGAAFELNLESDALGQEGL